MKTLPVCGQYKITAQRKSHCLCVQVFLHNAQIVPVVFTVRGPSGDCCYCTQGNYTGDEYIRYG